MFRFSCHRKLNFTQNSLVHRNAFISFCSSFFINATCKKSEHVILVQQQSSKHQWHALLSECCFTLSGGPKTTENKSKESSVTAYLRLTRLGKACWTVNEKIKAKVHGKLFTNWTDFVLTETVNNLFKTRIKFKSEWKTSSFTTKLWAKLCHTTGRSFLQRWIEIFSTCVQSEEKNLKAEKLNSVKTDKRCAGQQWQQMCFKLFSWIWSLNFRL